MVKALRVVLIIWAVIAILMGLVYIFFPGQLNEMGGYENTAYVVYLLALLGICYIPVGAFVIIAARDPLRNIMWVQFAIAMAILTVVVIVYSIGRGFVTFEQEGMPLVFNVVFAVALLALYPWRAAKE
jgi:hypothetical protein